MIVRSMLHKAAINILKTPTPTALTIKCTLKQTDVHTLAKIKTQAYLEITTYLQGGILRCGERAHAVGANGGVESALEANTDKCCVHHLEKWLLRKGLFRVTWFEVRGADGLDRLDMLDRLLLGCRGDSLRAHFCMGIRKWKVETTRGNTSHNIM